MAVTYNAIITRNDTSAIENVNAIVDEIIQGVSQGSAVLPLLTKLPNMTNKQAKMAVLSALPEAYWVEGDNGLKGTTKAAWAGKFITAEELAVVVPIAQSVLDDADYDIWAEIKPRVIEQFYKKIDQAIINGTDKPASWGDAIVTAATTKGFVVNPTSNLYDDISDAMSLVEEAGFDVTGILGGVKAKGIFRKGLRDSTGQPLQGSEVTELPRAFAKNGSFDETAAKLIVGDFKQGVYAIRRDIEFKVFDSGVVTDSNGDIIYNLMQQDMVALRVTMRLGYQLPNPINVLQPTEALRLPFAYVAATASEAEPTAEETVEGE